MTGRAGRDPSLAELRHWALQHGRLNVALRMPLGVAGIDVDAYTGHDGATTLGTLQARHGLLPLTCRSTSRAPEDPLSGIYLYRIPVDVELAGTAGPGIDIIQRHHRYAIVGPSIHPETGRRYRWWWEDTPDSRDFTPSPYRLPELPESWLDFLTSTASVHRERADVTLAEARDWYLRRAYGTPCAWMAAEGDKAVAQLSEAAAYGGLHDTLNIVTLRLFRWAAEGHPGLDSVVCALRPVFCDAGRPRGRDLAGEWRRALGGAAAQVAPDDAGDDDPCDELEGFRVW